MSVRQREWQRGELKCVDTSLSFIKCYSLINYACLIPLHIEEKSGINPTLSAI